MQILFHAHGLLAVDKPSGMAVHEAPGPGGSVLRELREVHGFPELTPVHRLDKGASGVLLFAESKALAAEVQREWGRAEKVYVALCEGVPEKSEGMIDAPILENQTGKPERLRNALRYFEKTHPGEAVPPVPAPKTSGVHPAGRGSQTEYRVLNARGDVSLIEVRPRQGRMHQIRVHLAQIGCPIVGDGIYGRGKIEVRMMLHAAELKVWFRGERIVIRAEVPDELGRW